MFLFLSSLVSSMLSRFRPIMSQSKGKKTSSKIETTGGVLLPIRCKPGAKSSRVTGVSEDQVEISIAAPPSGGEANSELVQFLAKSLGCRKSDMSLSAGHKSRDKVVRIESSSLTLDLVRDQLRKQIE